MLPGRRLNRQDIETERSVSGAVFAEKLPCDARKMPLLLMSDRIFWRAELASRSRSRLYLDKRDRRAIVSYQVDFALHTAIGEVFERSSRIRAAADTNTHKSRRERRFGALSAWLHPVKAARPNPTGPFVRPSPPSRT